jgi:MOSC domain-containing protein YiiM
MTQQGPGTIISIQLCRGHRLPMQQVERGEAVADFGLQGDHHARSGSQRQVLLVDLETLALLGLLPGEIKENITTEGVDLKNLRPGQELRVGDSVRLEITQPCEPCGRMEEIRVGLAHELENRRGMLARVIAGGQLSVGDPVRTADKV